MDIMYIPEPYCYLPILFLCLHVLGLVPVILIYDSAPSAIRTPEDSAPPVILIFFLDSASPCNLDFRPRPSCNHDFGETPPLFNALLGSSHAAAWTSL